AAKNFGNLDDAVEAYQDKIIKGGEAADKLNVDFVNFDKYLAIALAQTGGRPMTLDELAAAKYDIGMGIVGRAGTAMKVLPDSLSGADQVKAYKDQAETLKQGILQGFTELGRNLGG